MNQEAPCKTCRKCGIEKPLSQFYSHRNNKDGKSGHCKKCHAKPKEKNPYRFY